MPPTLPRPMPPADGRAPPQRRRTARPVPPIAPAVPPRRYIQELLGHASTRTTEIYTHVSNRELGKIRNPLDALGEDGE